MKYTSNSTDNIVNQVIEEMMGFSPDSDALANSILKYVLDEVKAGNVERHSDADKDFGGGAVYTLRNPIAQFTVSGKTNIYLLQLRLVNFPGDTPDKVIYDSSESACEGSHCQTLPGKNGKPVFVVDITLMFKDWEVNQFSKGVFHHEVKHVFSMISRVGDKNVMDVLNNQKIASLQAIYHAANKIMGHPLTQIVFPEMGIMANSVYTSDMEEISSFTQQAWKAMEDVKSFQDVDKAIRNTQLYMNLKFLQFVYSKLENDEGLYTRFSNMMTAILDPGEKMPTKHLYMKILKKRIDKYATNVGKVLVYTKDRLRDGGIKEGYSVPFLVYDGTWADVYKLGLY